MSKFRTIFITIFQGVEAKNILRTDIFKELISHADIRIVFFVRTREKEDFYQKQFGHPRVFYEVVSKIEQSFWQRFFGSLKFKLINTSTIDWRHRLAFEVHKSQIRFWVGWLLNRLLAHRFVRKICRSLDMLLVKDSTFAVFFDKYRPAAVISAHPFDDIEASLLKEAKRRKVKTFGLANSWDKITGRCALRVLPDKLIVYNDLVKKDAMDYADLPSGDIFVGGVPHYDQHINQPKLSRSSFLEHIGGDPNKEVIFYAPLAKRFISSRWSMIDYLQLLIEKDVIKNAQLLVRFQPNDFVEMDEVEKRKNIIFDIPGIRFSTHMLIGAGIDWDLSSEDIEMLTNSLYHCDVLVSYASSLCIDASIFNKPVININFELSTPLSTYRSPTELYKMTHYLNALKTGAIRLVNNKEEMVVWINKYLENPKLDEDNRKKLLEEQCHVLDGKAGKRTADFIISNLNL